MCLPLIVQNSIMGVLVLHTPVKVCFTSYEQQLATSFCEVITLSLSNIKLRESLYDQTIHYLLTTLFNRRSSAST